MHVILATVALGLGVDFPDVERVIHYGCSQTLEQFYQESGRGGRSGQRAMLVLYFNRHDVREDRVKPEMRNYCLAGYCLRHAIVEHFGFKLAEGYKCMNVVLLVTVNHEMGNYVMHDTCACKKGGVYCLVKAPI